MLPRTRNAIVTASIFRNLTVETPVFLVAGIARVNLNLPGDADILPGGRCQLDHYQELALS